MISWNVSATNVETESEPLTRDLLLELSKSGEYNKVAFKLNFLTRAFEKIPAYISYKHEGERIKKDCKFICASEKGIFIYKSANIEFIPYREIEFIQRATSFNKTFLIVSAGGIVGGALMSLAFENPAPLIIVPAALSAINFGISGPIYLIAKNFKSFRYPINEKQENGKSFLNFINRKKLVWGKNNNILNYPIIDESLISQPVIKNDTASIASKNNHDSIPSMSILIPGKTIEFPKLNTPSGKINPEWMYYSFNKLDVNEKKLMAKFKNIQGTQLIVENLQSLNPSELKFLAITIATINGYNFRNIANFSESQNQNLKNYESYVSYEVKPNSEIDPNNLQELDLNNINLIYSILKEKNI